MAAIHDRVAIDKGSAVRNVGIVIEHHRPVTPVKSPVVPAPSKTSEEAHIEPEPKSETRSI